jgi:hypothetical protein
MTTPPVAVEHDAPLANITMQYAPYDLLSVEQCRTWVAAAMLGIGQGGSSLLRPLLLSRRLNPVDHGRGAAQSAVARAVAPLLLAAAVAPLCSPPPLRSDQTTKDSRG